MRAVRGKDDPFAGFIDAIPELVVSRSLTDPHAASTTVAAPEVDAVQAGAPQNSPTTSPDSSRSMEAAAGCLGSPGMVRISPLIA